MGKPWGRGASRQPRGSKSLAEIAGTWLALNLCRRGRYNVPRLADRAIHLRRFGFNDTGRGTTSDRSVHQCTKAALIAAFGGAPGTLFVSSALSLCLHLVVCEAVMRVIIIAAVSALLTLHASSAAAQNFEERWSIIPKAHAEPPPKTDDQNKPDPQAQPPSAPQDTSSSKGEATRT